MAVLVVVCTSPVVPLMGVSWKVNSPSLSARCADGSVLSSPWCRSGYMRWPSGSYLLVSSAHRLAVSLIVALHALDLRVGDLQRAVLVLDRGRSRHSWRRRRVKPPLVACTSLTGIWLRSQQVNGMGSNA